MHQNSKAYKSRFKTEMKTRWVLSKTNTERLEQRQSNSWTPVDSTKVRVSNHNQLYEARPADMQINTAAKFLEHQTCSVSHNIYAVAGSFLTSDFFFFFSKLI